MTERVKDISVTSCDVRRVTDALTKVRGQLGLNNAQLFNALSQALPNYVHFPIDRRTSDYKTKRRLTDSAVKSISEMIAILN